MNITDIINLSIIWTLTIFCVILVVALYIHFFGDKIRGIIKYFKAFIYLDKDLSRRARQK